MSVYCIYKMTKHRMTKLGQGVEVRAHYSICLKHVTGYAGSRDYVGTPQSPQKTSHQFTHAAEKQTPDPLAQNSCERIGVCFSVGCVDRCGVFCGDCGVFCGDCGVFCGDCGFPS